MTDSGDGAGPRHYSGVQVFTATKAHERSELGAEITSWLAAHPGVEVVDTIVRQSSDQQFHCLTIILFYRPAR